MKNIAKFHLLFFAIILSLFTSSCENEDVIITHPTPLIGDFYEGGYIFYLDNTLKIGLVCAPYDQSDSIVWWNGSNITTGAYGTKVLTGQANTTAIVSAQGIGSYAAKLCDDLVLNGHSDWFLPSYDELDLMYENLYKNNIGSLDGWYWTSSEWSVYINSSAYAHLNSMDMWLPLSKSSKAKVRAVRSINITSILPTITTTVVSAIAASTATSGGVISTAGSATVTARGVCWSTATSPTITLPTKTVNGSGIGPFTSSLTGLSPLTKYYVRAYATSSAGTAYGNEVNFTTLGGTLPTLTTTSATSITSTSAASGGNISAAGSQTVTARGVCWSTTTNPTVALTTKTVNGSGIGTFTSSITGLAASTKYYVRAYATSSVGTAYGNEVNFTTLSGGTLPTLTTTAISSLSSNAANCGGNVTSAGTGTVTAKGVCWSTATNPTIALATKTVDGSGVGTFTSNITGLTASTKYYVRAYATSSIGTAYGSEVNFTTNATITDIDGNIYNTVTIGTQTWMKENLKTTKYRDGTAIANVTDNTLWSNLTTGAYCWYSNAIPNKTTYGALYNYYTVIDGHNLCPTGWHIPTDAEWTTLTTYLGGTTVAGGKLKETGTTHWLTPNTGATNSSNFMALPAGARVFVISSFSFNGLTESGNWWSATASSTTNAWFVSVSNTAASSTRSNNLKTTGLSVRCVKN